MRTIRTQNLLAILLATQLSGCLIQEAKTLPEKVVLPSPATDIVTIDDQGEFERARAYANGYLPGGIDPAAVDSYESHPGKIAETEITETEIAEPEIAEPEIATKVVIKPETIWDRLRKGYQLPVKVDRRVQAELDWYVSHPAYIDRVIERARPFLGFILSEIELRGMPTEIALLPIVESAFQPFAYSHGRAAGLWQFIPATGRMYDLKQNWWYDGRRDIYAATQAALNYLDKLHGFVKKDWLLALAAYNSGAGTVLKAVRKNKRKGKKTDFWSLRLPKETQAYVPRLIALSILFANPEKYKITFPEMEDKPYFAVVDTGSQIDLALAADLADISMSELYRLNPAFNQWATDPKGPHRLLVPAEKAADFSLKLLELKPNDRIKWKRHRIREGDSLLVLAKKYRTTVPLIRKVNKIRGNMIRAGRHLVIPVAAKSLSTYSKSSIQRKLSLHNTTRKGKKQFYTVRSGDTLWDISRAYKVQVRALAKWNGMAPRDMLREGQRLVIWSGKRPIITSSHSSPSGAIRTIRYTVRNGDSLARISQRFKVSVTDLRRWNRLPGNRYLQPGQKLTLKVDVTRQSGLI